MVWPYQRVFRMAAEWAPREIKCPGLGDSKFRLRLGSPGDSLAQP